MHDTNLEDEVRITVIAAGFDRFEGERMTTTGGTTSLGLRQEESKISASEPTGSGDDDFDVPDFLR